MLGFIKPRCGHRRVLRMGMLPVMSLLEKNRLRTARNLPAWLLVPSRAAPSFPPLCRCARLSTLLTESPPSVSPLPFLLPGLANPGLLLCRIHPREHHFCCILEMASGKWEWVAFTKVNGVPEDEQGAVFCHGSFA